MFNIIRSSPAPASLAGGISYAGEDVLHQLKNDFHNKCYLCEVKEPHDINVEHFRPCSNNPSLKFDWNNLFYACSRCNNIKLAGYENILDCTSDSVDVFRTIKLLPPMTPRANLVDIKAMIDDYSTSQTVELLEKIYNEPNTENKRVTAAHLRHKVFKSYNRLLELMNVYFSNEATDEQKHDSLGRMRVLMKGSQEFSAFLRWVVLGDEELKPILETDMN